MSLLECHLINEDFFHLLEDTQPLNTPPQVLRLVSFLHRIYHPMYYICTSALCNPYKFRNLNLFPVPSVPIRVPGTQYKFTKYL